MARDLALDGLLQQPFDLVDQRCCQRPSVTLSVKCAAIIECYRHTRSRPAATAAPRRLAGDDAFVDPRMPGLHDAVRGDAIAGAHQHAIARRERGNRHAHDFIAAKAVRGLAF